MIDQMVAWCGRALLCFVLSLSVAPAADFTTAFPEHNNRQVEVIDSHDADRRAGDTSGSGRTCQGPGSCWSLPHVLAYDFLPTPGEGVLANFSGSILTEWILPPLDRPPRRAA